MSSTNTYTEQKYCVYITHYSGDKLPANYIGSTSIKKIKHGYKGSVCSKKYKSIWNSEIKENPELFSVDIISQHDTRREATYKELHLQKMCNVMENDLFVNESYARINGFFGRDVSGKNNPRYGKTVSDSTKEKISISKIGKKLNNTTSIKNAAQLRKRENSWNQLKDKPKFFKFNSYIDFEQAILAQYKICHKIPSLIAKKLDITEGSVITLLKHNNLQMIIDPKFTKLINNYGPKWSSYSEYQNDIIKLHNTGIGIYQIADILKINPCGVNSALKIANITPHEIRRKSGPKPKNLL